jgi:hypothetical protein
MEKIKASEGMYLTQKEIENESARVFAVSLFLADNDSADNWREATMEEYYKWQQEQDAKLEAQMNSVKKNTMEEVKAKLLNKTKQN